MQENSRKTISRTGWAYKRKTFPYLGYFDMKELEMEKQEKYPIQVMEYKQFKEYELKNYIIKKAEDIVFDFGEEFVGDCYFQIEGEGTATFIYGESLDETYASIKENSCNFYRLPLFKLKIKKGQEEYTSEGRRAFRYLRIKSETGVLTVKSVKVIAEHCKIRNKNSFEGLDDKWKAINDICERTTRLCMQQWLEDGVKRDGQCWVSDARLIAICNYALFGETEIVKKSLQLFAESQKGDGEIICVARGADYAADRMNYMYEYGKNPNFKGRPEYVDWYMHYIQYSVDFINMAWEYYEFSGDKEFIKDLYPFIKRDMANLVALTPKKEFNGLLPSPGNAREDGKHIDQGGFLSTYYAFFVFGTKNYRKIAELFDDKAEMTKAEKYIEVYTQRYKAFLKDGYIYDKERNGYYCSPESAHCMGYLSGILTKEEYLTAVKKGKENAPSTIVDGYWKYWKIRAMFEAGLCKEAEKEMCEYWGVMLQYGATTCWEHYDKDNMYILNDFIMSRCHGWSAGATDLIKRYILKCTETQKYAGTFNKN